MATTYKLIYFNTAGLAEVIRLIFAEANQTFEDFRYPMDDEKKAWLEYKPSTPLGTIPLLEISENSTVTQLSQSKAIARYLARKFGLAGKTEIDQAFVNQWVDQINDLLTELGKFYYEQDAEKKAEIGVKVITEILPKNLGYFEAQIVANKSGFLVGPELTWVDIYLFSVVDLVKPHLPGAESIFASCPHLAKLLETVAGRPNIAAWIEKRPKA